MRIVVHVYLPFPIPYSPDPSVGIAPPLRPHVKSIPFHSSAIVCTRPFSSPPCPLNPVAEVPEEALELVLLAGSQRFVLLEADTKAWNSSPPELWPWPSHVGGLHSAGHQKYKDRRHLFRIFLSVIIFSVEQSRREEKEANQVAEEKINLKEGDLGTGKRLTIQLVNLK